MKKLYIILVVILVLISIFYGEKSYFDYRINQVMENAKKIPDSYWDEKYQDFKIKDKYKIVIVYDGGGEAVYTSYFKKTAENLGWEVKSFFREMIYNQNEILAFDPDFILFITLGSVEMSLDLSSHRSKKYLISFIAMDQWGKDDRLFMFFDYVGSKKNITNIFLSAHAIITANREVDIFHQMFERMDKEFNGFRMFPTVPKTNYTPAEPKNITWGGMSWDKTRSSEKYKEFIRLLSDGTSLKIYGPAGKFTYVQKSYDGLLPVGMDIINTIHKNGIYLLTHSSFHLQGGVPSMRIFEAAAANSVIISDRNPFVIENFGDSVLYFDQEASAEEMYRQVKAHYDWILANPEKAKAMAEKAHEIFLQKYTLEKDLIRIAKMHEYILAKEKSMKLTGYLVY